MSNNMDWRCLRVGIIFLTYTITAPSAYGQDAPQTHASESIIGVDSAAQAQRLEHLQAREDSIVAAINRQGIGQRFRVASLLPEAGSCSGSITVESIGSSQLVRLRTYYPKDKLEFTLSLSGARPRRCLGAGSVWRFIGKVEFLGVTFVGDEEIPLAFMFHNRGFVYLHGRGEVITADGSQEEFR